MTRPIEEIANDVLELVKQFETERDAALAEVERLKGRILKLESTGAVNAVARPLKAERDRYSKALIAIALANDTVDGAVGAVAHLGKETQALVREALNGGSE